VRLCLRQVPRRRGRASSGVRGQKQNAVPQKICENEMPTGSHIATVVCRDPELADRQRAFLQIRMNRPLSGPPETPKKVPATP
jgi:hypothetical protein